MSNAYGTLCDDFGVSAYILGKVDMPNGRETVLHFFDSVRKAVPSMSDFEKREGGEFALEEDREAGSYRWSTLDARYQAEQDLERGKTSPVEHRHLTRGASPLN